MPVCKEVYFVYRKFSPKLSENEIGWQNHLDTRVVPFKKKYFLASASYSRSKYDFLAILPSSGILES